MSFSDINTSYLMILLIPLFTLFFSAVFYLFGRLIATTLLAMKSMLQGRS